MGRARAPLLGRTLGRKHAFPEPLGPRRGEHGTPEGKAQEAPALPKLYFPDTTEALLRKQQRSAVRSKPKPLRKHSIR